MESNIKNNESGEKSIAASSNGLNDNGVPVTERNGNERNGNGEADIEPGEVKSPIRTTFLGVPLQMYADRSEDNGTKIVKVEVLCQSDGKPVPKKMLQFASVSTEGGKTSVFVHSGGAKRAGMLMQFSQEIMKSLEEKNALDGAEESRIFVCSSLLKTVNEKAENLQKSDSAQKDKALLASSYGKKPDDMGEDVKTIFDSAFDALKSLEEKGDIEELRLLSIYLSLVIKYKKESTGEPKKTYLRVFNQHMDKNGFFSWYLRKQDTEGKLGPTKYYGTSLPDNLDLEKNKVNFHPQFVADAYGLRPKAFKKSA